MQINTDLHLRDLPQYRKSDTQQTSANSAIADFTIRSPILSSLFSLFNVFILITRILKMWEDELPTFQ